MKRVVIIGSIVVAAALLTFVWSRSQAAKREGTVVTAPARRTDFVRSVSSSGKVKADRSVDLKFQTSGKLAWVGVSEGIAVRAYQTIASLDTRDVRKTLEKYLVDYSVQRNTFEDTRKYDYPANKPQDALNERMKHLLEKNQWDLDKAVLDVELKYLAVEYSTLVTPIAGIVTHIDTPVAGVNITPASAVFSVADPASLVFEANVDETDIGSLVVGQDALLTLDAFPDATFSGKISYISYVAETSSGGATVFPVKIAFANPAKLRMGLNGDVTIEVERQMNVLTVPVEAVREDDGDKYVWRKTGNAYERVAVTVGSLNDDEAVITSGLTDGDIVVTKGFSTIKKSK